MRRHFDVMYTEENSRLVRGFFGATYRYIMIENTSESEPRRNVNLYKIATQLLFLFKSYHLSKFYSSIDFPSPCVSCVDF